MGLKNERIFITGISGFVGSYVAKYLLNQGAKISGLIRRRADGSMPQNLIYLGIEDDVELLEGDICDISSLAFALDRSKPNVIFHLAAQSFIPRSFSHPWETLDINFLGTVNLLETVRAKNLDPTIVFAGSSEEYGLAIVSKRQYQEMVNKYGAVFPEPELIPELPINETNPLRPMSPYAVSKVSADYAMRNYHNAYGLKTIVSRAFNHEGAGRGKVFVTSAITSQVMKLKRGEIAKITIGNVNAFRDWSHISDIVKGYCLLAEKGKPGEVYVQGSQRTNSVLSYLLLSLECAGYTTLKIETAKGDKAIDRPTDIDNSEIFGLSFEKTKVDKLMLQDKLVFAPSDIGIIVTTEKGKVTVEFDQDRFRPAEVPILLSNTAKIQKLGFKIAHSLKDIINDQLNYYLDPAR
ncbi:MAG TPA: GDP-mannose 4,6-dehydratase [Dehalococcoidia bacterium]|nr:GDP-mannose 4,6-dehydratase [Dehalococcoidia bacterium]